MFAAQPPIHVPASYVNQMQGLYPELPARAWRLLAFMMTQDMNSGDLAALLGQATREALKSETMPMAEREANEIAEHAFACAALALAKF